MRKLQIYILLTTICFISSCALKAKDSPQTIRSKNQAMLLDPEVNKDFRELKKIAEGAQLYKQNEKTYIADKDIQKMDALSSSMIRRLESNYNISAKKHKIHTYIGKNQFDSCYQYYNSLAKSTIGKDCHEFPRGFANCELCNEYIKKLRARAFGVIHMHWWNNEPTSARVVTLKLRNGDNVYLGLEISY